MTMDRDVTRLVQARAERAIREAFAADPMLKHIETSYGGGTIAASGASATLKFIFLDKNVAPSSAFGGKLTNDAVVKGLAGTKTPVLFGGKKYTILKVRRIKYLARCEEDGLNYTLPFRGCTLDESRLSKQD